VHPFQDVVLERELPQTPVEAPPGPGPSRRRRPASAEVSSARPVGPTVAPTGPRRAACGTACRDPRQPCSGPLHL